MGMPDTMAQSYAGSTCRPIETLGAGLSRCWGCPHVGFGFITRLYRETRTVATIEVSPEQFVISTGPYAVVRHPMHASALLYLIGTPLALGWCVGFLPLDWMLPFLPWRLIDEERVLVLELPGCIATRPAFATVSCHVSGDERK